jgi:hypothetical protein
VKVFVDEDTGSNLGRVLRLLGVEAEFVGSRRSIRPGARDEVWIPWAAKQGRLVFSRNLGILATEAQHDLLVAEKLGIVFLPPGLKRFDMARLVLRRWERLVALDADETRPFAFKLGASGQFKRQAL